MESSYKRIGDYIQQVDLRNSDSSVTELIGVSISKTFMESVANTIGTDLSKYKVISKGQFACSLMQVSRDGGIAISLYKENSPAIMSPAYYIFEVSSKDLLAEYLELVVYNPLFDREAVFNAIGGVRGTLSWEEFCDMKINVPSLEDQQKIVRQYKTITERIEVLEKINEKFIDFMVKYNGYFIKKHKDNGEVGRLEQLCQNIYSGGTPTTTIDEYWDGELPWLASGETSNAFVIKTEKTITELGAEKSSTKLAPKGCTVIASAGQGKTRGQTSYLLKDMYVNQSVIVLKPIDGNGAYIFSNLKGRYEELRTGSDLNSIRGSLTTTEIKDFPIFIPSDDDMKEYQAKVGPIIAFIEANVREIELLSHINIDL